MPQSLEKNCYSLQPHGRETDAWLFIYFGQEEAKCKSSAGWNGLCQNPNTIICLSRHGSGAPVLGLALVILRWAPARYHLKPFGCIPLHSNTAITCVPRQDIVTVIIWVGSDRSSFLLLLFRATSPPCKSKYTLGALVFTWGMW